MPGVWSPPPSERCGAMGTIAEGDIANGFLLMPTGIPSSFRQREPPSLETLNAHKPPMFLFLPVCNLGLF